GVLLGVFDEDLVLFDEGVHSGFANLEEGIDGADSDRDRVRSQVLDKAGYLRGLLFVGFVSWIHG
ncbi:MAG: hypothetical protein ACFFCO_11350, partial [Promethearchaeota archaeon]